MRMEVAWFCMEIFDYKQLAEILKVDSDLFIRKSGYYEDKIRKKGYDVKKEGKGKKAVYIIEYNGNVNNDISWWINKVFGFVPKKPTAMYKFLYFIKTNNIEYLSDTEIALKLGYTKNSKSDIHKCRKQLQENGYMSVDKEKIKYYSIHYDSNFHRNKKEIDGGTFFHMTERMKKLRNENDENLVNKMYAEFGGVPSRMVKRNVSLLLISKLESDEYADMLKHCNINWRKR